MRLFILTVLTIILLISCSNKGDKYIGVYMADRLSIITITKAGTKGYFISDYYNNRDYKDSGFYIFKDGCFYKNEVNEHNPVFCIEGASKLIRDDGHIYMKTWED